MRVNMKSIIALASFVVLFAACAAKETKLQEDFAFDGTCVNCHAGMSAGHTHQNYKLRCVDCHGGNDQIDIPADAANDPAIFRDPVLIGMSHVLPVKDLARFYYANGVDDDGDGKIDEGPTFDNDLNPTQVIDFGEELEPNLHGQGIGEFFDTELNRDLNYTRWLNPGDLRVATIGCGGRNRAAIDAGVNEAGNGCHQDTIDIVRRSIMVNQAAVTNGAYYGNESFRTEFIDQRKLSNSVDIDPRAGAFGYQLDYDGADGCVDDKDAVAEFAANGPGGRVQPKFDSACLQLRAAMEDAAVAAGAPGNEGLPAFEIAQGSIGPAAGSAKNVSEKQIGAVIGKDKDGNDVRGGTRLPWGGLPTTGDERDIIAPLLNNVDAFKGVVGDNVPDPVDLILRTFRAYYPQNYPGSTTNFNFTFGTSILPDIARFATNNPFGRGHSSGCAGCHMIYNYNGNREATLVVQDDGTVVPVTDPTTKHREFDPAQDFGVVDGVDRLIGRIVFKVQQDKGFKGDNKPVPQQKTYSKNHLLTAKIDTDTCGLCHGFVTRINYAYQGLAEEEQRDQLARRAPITFTTPTGTKVAINDSWVREDNDDNNDGTKDLTPTIHKGDKDGVALDVIAKAKKRDADLAAQGFIPGNGGCAQEQFSEDCNNDGELETELTLEQKDIDGNVIKSITINEDLNMNGTLDLIDRLPRENSIDGRQVRYVYGGRNGSTRQMDVHFQVGMACIDCHFVQDIHGDGHVYTTNWDNIEIECEDCHGSATTKATLVTSGPNGGNDLTKGVNDDLERFFERRNGKIIQRSRVVLGLTWEVPQTVDQQSPYALEGHGNGHVGEQGEGSTFEGDQGQSKLLEAKVECATCHNGWIHNCMGCHVEVSSGDPQRKTVAADNSIQVLANENEVWMSNAPNPGHINFQLLGLLRAPFVLGTGSKTEKGRLSLFRSSMQAQVTVQDPITRETVLDNATFTTFQGIDGNSGRMNVATSGVAMNQTMAHTVRPQESRGCELCHQLVDDQGRARNEHILAQTFGVGTGAAPYVGDWAIAAGLNGIELYEYKSERELATQLKGASERFPGLVVNPGALANGSNLQGGGNKQTPGNVEPQLGGTTANDVLLIRNFNPEPAIGGTQAPTLRDVAVLATDNNGVLVVDITRRGVTGEVRPNVGDANKVFQLNVGATPVALAHLSPDVSDPFVYAAVGNQGIAVIKIENAPSAAQAAASHVGANVPLNGKTTTSIAISGDIAYLGTAEGFVEVVSLADPNKPVAKGEFNVGSQINQVFVSGFLLYAATEKGITALDLTNVEVPAPPAGNAVVTFVDQTAPARGVYVSEGHAYVASAAGVFDVDYRTVATPVVVENMSDVRGQTVNARDVVVSRMPGQLWVLALDSNGDLVGLKQDRTQALYEKCYPNPGTAGCLLDMEFMDATQGASRDPSFDPINKVFDNPEVDPSALTAFRQPHAILGSGKRLAQPAQWEQINTLTGRRVRDSFMAGSGTLSTEVMQTMRSIQVCETADASTNPSGLNLLGYFLNGTCTAFTGEGPGAMKPRRVCKVEQFGSTPVCHFVPTRAAPAKQASPQVARPAPRVYGPPSPIHTTASARAAPRPMRR